MSYSRGAHEYLLLLYAFLQLVQRQLLRTIICLSQQPRQLRSDEVRLINSMADQIGVAVENINLFEQVRNKTAELESSNSELREALEQQTATSEILRVIASSPTDIQTQCSDVVAENAARLCEAKQRSGILRHGWRTAIGLWLRMEPVPVPRPGEI